MVSGREGNGKVPPLGVRNSLSGREGSDREGLGVSMLGHRYLHHEGVGSTRTLWELHCILPGAPRPFSRAPSPHFPSSWCVLVLQIALKNYDPQRDKRFSGNFKLPTVPK